jgi:sugar phosphate isomerase/epimerase
MQSSLDRDDMERSFEWAAQADAEGLEITCSNASQAKFLFTPVGCSRIAELAAQNKVQATSLALGILCQSESFLGDDTAAKAAGEIVSQAIECCTKTGMGVVLIPFFGKSSIEIEEHVNRLPDRLADLAELAEQAGVVLGIESLMNINQQLYLLDSLAAYKSVKIYIDSANSLPRKIDPSNNIRDLGKERVCQIHLKDVHLADAQKPDFNVDLGQGDVDLPAVVNSIAAIHYDGWVILETPPGEKPLESAKRNVQTARQLLGKAG